MYFLSDIQEEIEKEKAELEKIKLRKAEEQRQQERQQTILKWTGIAIAAAIGYTIFIKSKSRKSASQVSVDSVDSIGDKPTGRFKRPEF